MLVGKINEKKEKEKALEQELALEKKRAEEFLVMERKKIEDIMK